MHFAWRSWEKRLRYLFDITTSAHWRGPHVGITRLEEELGRRARQFLGEDVTFCVYDKYRNQFLSIDDSAAAKIFDDTLAIDIKPPPDASLGGRIKRCIDVARRSVRRALMSNIAVYHALQRMRGRAIAREELLRIRAEHAAPGNAPVEMRPVTPDENTVVISGGLGWEHMDLRKLKALKEAKNFRYHSVVYDLIPILFPHFVVPAYAERFVEYFGELQRISDHVMCISEATRRDWLRFCDNRGDRPIPADVFPLGSDLGLLTRGESAPALPEALAGKRYALFVSTLEPRKNHRMLYDAWQECLKSGLIDIERDRLVFVGRRGWLTGDLLHELSYNPATRDTIMVLNTVDDTQLKAIYRHCAFVVFPSHYEGYGLPVAEALGHGKPCVCSSSGSLSEIGGDLVIRLDPQDTQAWARALARYLSSPDELAAWTARVASEYRPVTWDAAAQTFFTSIVEAAQARRMDHH